MALWITLVLGCAPGGAQEGEVDDGGGDAQVATHGDADLAAPDGGEGGAELPACGDLREPPAPPPPIVNGTDSWDPEVVTLTAGQALAIGAIRLRRLDGSWVASCGATLISSKLAITAAHCFADRRAGRDGSEEIPVEDLRVALGEDSDAPAGLFEVERITTHPGYTRAWGSTAHHDVGVLVLREHATVALPGLEPLQLNCEPLDADQFVGQRVQNVGYGDTDPEGSTNARRHWTVEQVVELSDVAFSVDGMGVSSVCAGDSGGPSLWTMPDGVVRVVGTVSWGDESCVDVDRFARADDNCDFVEGQLEGCGDETPAGRCDGGRAVRCDEGAVAVLDCVAAGLACGDLGDGTVGCVVPLDACGGETAQGRCDGDDAVWCEGGAVRRRRCADCGQACGWVEALRASYCL